MPPWKVLLICVLACACLGLALATVLIPMAREGTDRWLWLAGLLASTAVTATLLTLFMRHAGRFLDVKTRGNRN